MAELVVNIDLLQEQQPVSIDLQNVAAQVAVTIDQPTPEEVINIDLLQEQQPVSINLQSVATDVAVALSQGTPGASAYQIYLNNTADDPPLSQAQWLASLQGPAGGLQTYTEVLGNVTTYEKAINATGLSAASGANLYDPDGYLVLPDLEITATHVRVHSTISLLDHKLIIY